MIIPPKCQKQILRQNYTLMMSDMLLLLLFIIQEMNEFVSLISVIIQEMNEFVFP